jgi:hypothetical protein
MMGNSETNIGSPFQEEIVKESYIIATDATAASDLYFVIA